MPRLALQLVCAALASCTAASHATDAGETDAALPLDARADAPCPPLPDGYPMVLDESIPALAATTRELGGRVMVMRTLAVGPTTFTEPTYSGGPADLYQRWPIATYTIEVVDPLGEDVAVGTTYEVVVIVAQLELVYPDGTRRCDWVVSDLPMIALRRPPAGQDWVMFGHPEETGLGAIRRVATLDGTTVSGAYTRDEVDVALDALRR